MRRNQRHTLEDYELEAKNNLEKNLANKVHLVMRQAEHRVSLPQTKNTIHLPWNYSLINIYFRLPQC